MTEIGLGAVGAILDRFVEGVFRLMLEHHQRQVLGMDLTLTQAQTLRILRATALPTGKLAAALGISAPAVTQLTDRLVRKQLIERRNIRDDRRGVNIGLTKKGMLIIDGFRERRNELFGDALSRLSEDDRIQVIQLLGKITAVLEAPEPSRLEPYSATRIERAEERTAVQPAHASKEVGHAPLSRPAKRMKIEWD